MTKQQRATRPALTVTITITMLEHDGLTAEIKTALAVDGQEWMVEAVRDAAERDRLGGAFDALITAVMAPIGECGRPAAVVTSRSRRVGRA